MLGCVRFDHIFLTVSTRISGSALQLIPIKSNQPAQDVAIQAKDEADAVEPF